MSMTNQENYLKQQIATSINDALILINNVIIANETGPSLSQAYGVAICFPTRYIDISYTRVPFAQQTKWLDLLDLMF